MASVAEKKARMDERLRFIRQYAAWVRRVDNETWSCEQAVLVNSFMENGSNILMDRAQYLTYVNRLKDLKVRRLKVRKESDEKT